MGESVIGGLKMKVKEFQLGVLGNNVKSEE